jgi:transcriptional regulator of arginine metabolism
MIEKVNIPSQDGLVAALSARGVSVTQSTLSRDLRELNVARVATRNGYRYQKPDRGDHDGVSPERMRELAALVVTGVAGNETVVTVRTLPARAQGLASYLDSLDLPEIVATVAGDDTVLVVPSSIKKTNRLRRRLSELLQL